MKTKTVILIGFLLSLPVIFVLANIIEQGDTNAVSMYFVVFLIPVLLFALLNGLYIRFISRTTSRIIKVFLSFIPLVILALLSLSKNLTIPAIDGNLTFATRVSAIALGLTNLLWLGSMLRASPK